jgi:hypothetical protein
MRTNITKKIIVAGAAGAQPLALLIGAALAALGFTANAHADSGNREFLAAMHGQEPGTTRMTAVKVPGGDAELLLLANVACDAYEMGGGLAAIAAVKAAEPNITFSRKDPMLILDAPTLLEIKALTYICPLETP